jgi:hypothetical protein
MIGHQKVMSRAGLIPAIVLGTIATCASAQAPMATPTPPQPTVPEVFTLMGQFVRVAYNNQGFVTLGYRAAQQSVGDEWMLLETGMTIMSPAKDYRLKREHLTVKTPDGSTIPLATEQEYMKADLRALNMRTRVIRDSINYFPMDATRGCAIQFFADLSGPGPRLAFDEVELSSTRACLGRLYFKVPGGIKHGQHWLHVKFAESEVQVPFRILTKEEEKIFSKTWEDLKKAHEAQYKKN